LDAHLKRSQTCAYGHDWENETQGATIQHIKKKTIYSHSYYTVLEYEQTLKPFEMATNKAIQDTDLLLVDEHEARRFYNEFLLPWGKSRLLQNSARQKYAPPDHDLGTKKCFQLDRVILRMGEATEDRFIHELRRFQVLAQGGMYKGTSTSQIETMMQRCQYLPWWCTSLLIRWMRRMQLMNLLTMF
jgi:hypothetical protein